MEVSVGPRLSASLAVHPEMGDEFLERMGFVTFQARPARMFIAMSTVREALSSSAQSKE